MQEEEYGQPVIPYQPEILRPPSPEEIADFSKWRLRIDDILELLEHDLRGDKYEDKKWIRDEKTKADMNDQGIKAIISIVRMLCNKYTTLSNLTNDEIITICGGLHEELATLLFFSYENFEINEDSLGIIMKKVMEFIFMSLKKAQNEGERISLAKAETVIRHYEPEKDKHFTFSSLSPFGRGKKEER